MRQVIESHETLLTTLTPSLTCQICLELMYIPYIISPCGHLACYTCLKSWFLNAPPLPPLLSDGNEGMRRVEGRKKTCPCCRGVVADRPVLVWGVKDLVAAVRKSGLAGVGSGVSSESVEPEAGDPWERIFYKRGAGPGLELGGGGALGFDMEGPLGMGFLDEEDGGALRCHDYMYEI